jgi:hypothetical protein
LCSPPSGHCAPGTMAPPVLANETTGGFNSHQCRGHSAAPSEDIGHGNDSLTTCCDSVVATSSLETVWQEGKASATAAPSHGQAPSSPLTVEITPKTNDWTEGFSTVVFPNTWRKNQRCGIRCPITEYHPLVGFVGSYKKGRPAEMRRFNDSLFFPTSTLRVVWMLDMRTGAQHNRRMKVTIKCIILTYASRGEPVPWRRSLPRTEVPREVIRPARTV